MRQPSTLPWEKKHPQKTLQRKQSVRAASCGEGRRTRTPIVTLHHPKGRSELSLSAWVCHHIQTTRAHTALPRAKHSCSGPQDCHICQRTFTPVSHKGPDTTSGLSLLLSPEGQQRQGTAQILSATIPSILHHVLFTPAPPQFCGCFTFHTIHTSTLCDWQGNQTGIPSAMLSQNPSIYLNFNLPSYDLAE